MWALSVMTKNTQRGAVSIIMNGSSSRFNINLTCSGKSCLSPKSKLAPPLAHHATTLPFSLSFQNIIIASRLTMFAGWRQDYTIQSLDLQSLVHVDVSQICLELSPGLRLLCFTLLTSLLGPLMGNSNSPCPKSDSWFSLHVYFPPSIFILASICWELPILKTLF